MGIKKKYSQAARVQAILRILGISQGITIGELAEVFEVTKRTIYRDLEALEESGYPIFPEVIEGTTYWKLESSFKNIPPVTLKIEYTPRKSNRNLTFEVHPYSLVLYKGELYILSYLLGKGMRYFALNGIKKAERSKDLFDIPEHFSPSKFLSASFGLFQGKLISLKVLFDQELSDYIQRKKWHQSQRIQKLKDGKVLLSLRTSGKEELKAWVLSFGPRAKVLSPKSLRKEIEADLQKMVLHYKPT